MPKRETRGPQLNTRAASFVSSTLDEKARTVQLIWTTGARVLRGYFDRYWEELSLEPKHVHLERLRAGAPLLDTHDASGIKSVIGVVESAQLEKTRGTAVVRFDSGEEGEDAMRRVREGTLRGVSVGYQVEKLVKVEEAADEIPVYRAVSWTPHELSLTPIGADAGAHVRSKRKPSMAPKKNIRTAPEEIRDLIVDEETSNVRTPDDDVRTPDNDRERCASIARITRAMSRSLDGDDARELEQLGDQLIRDGVSLERAKARIIDALANASAENGGVILFGKRSTDAMLRREALHSEGGRGRRGVELMAEALASRFGGPAPSAEARQYVRLSTVDFAKHFLEVRGVNTRTLTNVQIIERSIGPGMHSTSDFSGLLTETGNRILRASYTAYTGGLQRAARKISAPDFRAISKLSLGDTGTLEQVLEGGEFKNGTMAASKEAYSLATFGKIFALSRQAIINDDLGAFGQTAIQLGRTSAEFVASQLVTLLAANPAMATDGLAVFHTNHGNLTNTGTVLSVASLGVAMKQMRLQKGLDGTTPIDVTPKYLIVPAALETVARQTVAAITPAQTSNVNPWAGMLEVIVDPRLDAISATAWYLAADPAAIDGIEYAYLDGNEGPQIFINEGWRIDGTEWKVRLDFGAGFVDYRGWYKNNGA